MINDWSWLYPQASKKLVERPITSLPFPYGVCVENTTNSEQKVRIFFPDAKKEDNYGNADGVKLKAVHSEKSGYDHVLKQLDKKILTINNTVSKFIKGYEDDCFAPITIHEDTDQGEYHGKKMIMLADPYQQQKDIIINETQYQLRNIFATAGLIVTVNPKTTMQFYICPIVEQIDMDDIAEEDLVNKINNRTTLRLNPTSNFTFAKENFTADYGSGYKWDEEKNTVAANKEVKPSSKKSTKTIIDRMPESKTIKRAVKKSIPAKKSVTKKK